MGIKRGVSFYSYQQTQFFKELDLEGQIREVAQNLGGADGVEIIDEMSLHYPDPGDEFVRRWHGWMQSYGTVPVTMNVGMDVLRFRDHVMSHEECADRLRHDLRLAKRLGFANVKCLSVVPLDIMVSALPLAEELNIRIGKEIHQPMRLDGPEVQEIQRYVQSTGTTHLGIVPDFGVFGTRPSQVQLAWFERRGANPQACEAAVELSGLLATGSFTHTTHTAGNIRSAFTRFLRTGSCDDGLREVFEEVRAFTDKRVPAPAEIDYTVVAEALTLSYATGAQLRELVPLVVSVQAKFNHMSEIPGRAGEYEDIAIDTASAIEALKEGGYNGYLNTEYEGQRYSQDRTRAEMMDEVEQVRRHHEMMRRLLAS
ncbi:apurinic/apyrimidinic endonuclease family protein [Actinoplanes sp. RD1]|uniref:hypothetical protein n=1 Tax=Actinoplanes sp. RD1 TaxID=3064538 RepID=UPI0027428D70|nr:hypothetical protein [Actinoplanes sp. RD1]